MPVRLFNTARGELRVSTPEATAIDLAGYPDHAGGLDQVATILSELADEVDPAALEKAAASAPITWVQRLGYMLDLVDQEAAAGVIREYVQAHAREYAMLVPGRDQAGGHRAPQWKLVVNAELEPDI